MASTTLKEFEVSVTGIDINPPPSRCVVRYIITIKWEKEGIEWQVARRFNEFLKLWKATINNSKECSHFCERLSTLKFSEFAHIFSGYRIQSSKNAGVVLKRRAGFSLFLSNLFSELRTCDEQMIKECIDNKCEALIELTSFLDAKTHWKKKVPLSLKGWYNHQKLQLDEPLICDVIHVRQSERRSICRESEKTTLPTLCIARIPVCSSDYYLHVAALQAACWEGDYDTVMQILTNEEGINENSECLKTSFIVACGKGYVNIVQGIISSGININATGSNGATALYIASQEGHIDVIKLLLNENADTESISSSGATALHIACQIGRLDVVKLLLDQGNAEVDPSTCTGASPLVIAAGKGFYNIVECLLSHNACPNQTRHNGVGGLYIASQEGHVRVVQLLLDHGATIDQAAQPDGATPLLIACQQGCFEVVKALIGRGANQKAVTTSGFTALMIASAKGHLGIALWLLQCGADVNEVAADGNSALHHGCQNGNRDIVYELLKAGAVANRYSSAGLTPLDIAKSHDYHDIVELLKDYEDL